MEPLPELLRHAALLREQTQTALADFLSTDIDLGYTFLELARTTSDRDHANGLVGRTRTAVAAVRRLAEGVVDQDTRKEINDRVDALEAAVNAFPPTDGRRSVSI